MKHRCKPLAKKLLQKSRGAVIFEDTCNSFADSRDSRRGCASARFWVKSPGFRKHTGNACSIEAISMDDVVGIALC
jgi:hypothetical protein